MASVLLDCLGERSEPFLIWNDHGSFWSRSRGELRPARPPLALWRHLFIDTEQRELAGTQAKNSHQRLVAPKAAAGT